MPAVFHPNAVGRGTIGTTAKRALYTDGAGLNRSVEAVVLTCMVLVAVFVLFRVYRRLFITRNWGMDDCE